MAHQAHNIPWETLSANLKFTSESSRNQCQTNLFPRHKTGQGKQLMHFAKVFAQTITTASQVERAKYPSVYEAASPDEVVITDEAARKIQGTVHRYRSTNDHLSGRRTCRPGCKPSLLRGCSCPLSLDERRMSTWLLELDCRCVSCCYTFNHSDSTELAKTLLLHGQIEPLLRIAAHPSVALESKWSLPWEFDKQFGWSELVRSALMSYVCLNVFFTKPETYNAESRRAYLQTLHHERLPKEEDVDYRKTTSYQKTLSRCTGERTYEVHVYPHREFFGVAEELYDGINWRDGDAGRRRLGTSSRDASSKPPAEFYWPIRSDIPTVCKYLQLKGLPAEVALEILNFAEYVPRRRLPVAEDPLHIENAEELRKYLNYCWKLLIWGDVLAKACGRKIDWVYEATGCVWELWGVASPKMARVLALEEVRPGETEWLCTDGYRKYEFI